MSVPPRINYSQGTTADPRVPVSRMAKVINTTRLLESMVGLADLTAAPTAPEAGKNLLWYEAGALWTRNGAGAPVRVSPAAAGSATDAVIGNRTVNQAIVDASANTGTLTQILSWLAKAVVAISGTTNWFDAPAATIATIWGKFNATTGHTHAGTADQAPPLAAAGLATSAVTTIKILDRNVTTAKIALLGVTPAELAANAVETAKILDANVTDAKLATPKVSRTGDTMTGDLTVYRSATPTTGVVYLGNSGARYVYYDGLNYQMPNGPLYSNSQLVWTDGTMTDARVTTAKIAANATYQGSHFHATAGAATASTVFVDLMDRTLTTTGGEVMVFASATAQHDTVGGQSWICVAVDGGSEQATMLLSAPVAGRLGVVSTVIIIGGLSAASHIFRVRCRTDVGTTTFETRTMLAVELKR